MLVLETLRFACDTCIRGHRSSQCAHRDRDLLELRKKGRPRLPACDECRRSAPSKGKKTKGPSIECPHVQPPTTPTSSEIITLPSGQKLTLVSHQSANTVRDLLARGVQFVITTGAGAGNSAKPKAKPSASASSSSSSSSSASLNPLESSGSATSPAPVRVETVASLSSLLNPCNCQERTGRRCLCCDISDDADPVPCDSADCSCAHSVLGSLHLLPFQVSNAQPSTSTSTGGSSSCCGGGGSRVKSTPSAIQQQPSSWCSTKPQPPQASTSSCCAPQPQPPVASSSCCAPRPPPVVQTSCCAPPPQQPAPTSSCCSAPNRPTNSIDMLIAAANYTPATSAAANWTLLPLPTTTPAASTSTPPPTAPFDFPFLFPNTTTSAAPSASAPVARSPPLPLPAGSTGEPLLFGPATLAPIRSTAPPPVSSLGQASCIPLPTTATPGPHCAPQHPVASTNTLPSCCQPSATGGGGWPACCGAGGNASCTCCLPPATPPPTSPSAATTSNPWIPTSCCCTSPSGCTAGPSGCECTGASACGGECCARAKTRKRDRDEQEDTHAGGSAEGAAEGARVRKVQVNAQRRAMCTCGCVRPAMECGDCSRDLCVDFLLKDL